jgi:sugar O-acyltransferase (sialic acid O-acetyltransferase NeuD family)
MPAKSGEKLVIVGDGEFAEIACEYFTHDSPYEVIGFAVEQAFLTKQALFGRPVVAFEGMECLFPPNNYRAFVAITFTRLNRVRARLFRGVKAKGYRPVSYVSSHAFVWRDVEIGENCFVFENNVVQYKARIGDDVILWSGNHIGHRAVIGDHCFLSSHVVVSGYCEIGESCFIGVNSSIGDGVKVAKDCVIGAGAVIVGDTVEGGVYKEHRGGPSKVGSHILMRVRDEPQQMLGAA